MVGRLTGESDALNFSALKELCIEINVHLANSIFANKSRATEERIEQGEKISKKYDFFELPDNPPEQIQCIDLTDNAENISEKIKCGITTKSLYLKLPRKQKIKWS